MILSVLVTATYATVALAIVGGITAAAWFLASACRDRQRRIGYGYGLRDGMKDGYRRGKADAALSQVLATSTMDDHFSGALLSGALREPVSEDMKSLLGAVQELERAAKAEATS